MAVFAAEPTMKVVDDWKVQWSDGEKTATVKIDLPDYQNFKDEKYDSIVLFNPNGSPWRKATPLSGVVAQECCVFDALVVDSFKLKDAPDGKEFIRGKDYELDEPSGNIGYLEGGRIKADTPVYATYTSVQMRIDSIVENANGKITLVKGTPHQANPVPPELEKGQKRLGNVWISGRITKLTEDQLFPILIPEDQQLLDTTPAAEPIAKKLIPKTWNKLVNGEEIRILAWGDSVTACGYIPDEERWQAQFATRLQKMFPKANVVLMTEAWGGRNSDSYRNEPPGSPKNYKEKVLDLKPDLIVLEFVNDSGMDIPTVQKKYGEMLEDFRGIGADWIICTPHYVKKEWMGLTRERDICDDPRPYTTGLRQFTEANNIPLADNSLLYGRLWKQGIPYSTLLCNTVNHPNGKGMKLYADAIMRLFY